jgi:hypothetical protein
MPMNRQLIGIRESQVYKIIFVKVDDKNLRLIIEVKIRLRRNNAP